MHDIVTCEIELKWGFPWFWFQPPKLKPAEQRGHPSTSGLSLWVPSSVRPGSGEAERGYIGTVIFWDIMDNMPKEGLFIKKKHFFCVISVVFFYGNLSSRLQSHVCRSFFSLLWDSNESMAI